MQHNIYLYIMVSALVSFAVETTAVPIAGVLALAAGIIAARKGVSMFLVAVICCVIVFAAEMLI